jgi:hypothetical protein
VTLLEWLVKWENTRFWFAPTAAVPLPICPVSDAVLLTTVVGDMERPHTAAAGRVS